MGIFLILKKHRYYKRNRKGICITSIITWNIAAIIRIWVVLWFLNKMAMVQTTFTHFTLSDTASFWHWHCGHWQSNWKELFLQHQHAMGGWNSVPTASVSLSQLPRNAQKSIWLSLSQTGLLDNIKYAWIIYVFLFTDSKKYVPSSLYLIFLLSWVVEELKRPRQHILFLLGFSLDLVNPFKTFLGSEASLAFLSRLLTLRGVASEPQLRVFHITWPFTSLQPKASSFWDSDATSLTQRGEGVGQPQPSSFSASLPVLAAASEVLGASKEKALWLYCWRSSDIF